MFRRNNRITELIDEFGNQMCEVQERWMNVASHDHVLQALEYRQISLKVKESFMG